MANHAECIKLAILEFLKKKPEGILMCEGIEDGFYGTIDGISALKPEQSIELPCSENACVGMALGSASYGVLPILCFQRVEFALLAMEQLVNNGSKLNYLTDGERTNPCLFRFVIGRGWGQGPSHSQSLEALFAQIPETRVFLPVFPEDSEYIINSFCDEASPTISLEHRWIHYAQPKGTVTVSGSPYVVRKGKDCTIAATSYNVLMALKVADIFAEHKIEIEVINQFLVAPLNSNAVIASTSKTGRLLTLDLGSKSIGLGKALIADCAINGVLFESKPVSLGCKSSFSGSSLRLVDEYYLTAQDIGDALILIMDIHDQIKRHEILLECAKLDNSTSKDVPSKNFTGPF